MRASDAITYRLTTQWRFDAPLDVVWSFVADADGWPLWWRGIASVTLEPGDALGLGELRHYTCRGALPLQLRFVARVTRVVPQQLIEGRACGDLDGLGRCRLTHARGQTIVCFDWQVRTTGPWLNRLAPLAHALLRWNHDRLMRAGGRGLQRYLTHRALGIEKGSPPTRQSDDGEEACNDRSLRAEKKS